MRSGRCDLQYRPSLLPLRQWHSADHQFDMTRIHPKAVFSLFSRQVATELYLQGDS